MTDHEKRVQECAVEFRKMRFLSLYEIKQLILRHFPEPKEKVCSVKHCDQGKSVMLCGNVVESTRLDRFCGGCGGKIV